jgi:hypothetical protein
VKAFNAGCLGCLGVGAALLLVFVVLPSLIFVLTAGE